MIKKIYLILFISIIITSCGKKGDPVYKVQKLEIFSTKFMKIYEI